MAVKINVLLFYALLSWWLGLMLPLMERRCRLNVVGNDGGDLPPVVSTL
jgi:hypothetical protein